MIQKTLKTTQGKLHITIPGSLDEVSLGQMIDLQENPLLTDIGAISILSGIAIDQLQNIINIADLQVFAQPVLSIVDQISNMYQSDNIPKTITFGTGKQAKKVNVISNLSVEPAGAFMAARDIIADEVSGQINQHGEDEWQQHFNPSLKTCCQVLAHYFYCRATAKPYNEYAAEEFCTEIKKLRVTEALPIAKHFFTCYPNLSKPRTSCLHRLLPNWRKGLVSSRSKSLSISTR